MTDNAAPLRLLIERAERLIERAERLIEEKKGIQDDIKDIFSEAKAQGYDVPTMRWAIRERVIERQKREEQNALRETYGQPLGLFE